MWTTSQLMGILLELTCFSRIRWQNQTHPTSGLQEPSRSAGMLSEHVMTNVPPLARSYQDGGCRVAERVDFILNITMAIYLFLNIINQNNPNEGRSQSIPIPGPHPCFWPACVSLEVEIIILGGYKS